MPEPRHEPFPPVGVDLSKPSIARVYDYYLGGTANWAVDRRLGDEVMKVFPQAPAIAKANRRFLFRVVRHLMGLGVRQFVDLGAGLPTMDHTHSVADSYEAGTAHVVYVDNEPVAVAHSQVLLEEDGDPGRHVAINADLRAPQRLWDAVAATKLIDPTEPVALLMIAVLHVQQLDEHGDDIGMDIVAAYRDLLPVGSYLGISHVSVDGVDPVGAAGMIAVKELYDRSSSPVVWRSRREIADMFGDFDILPPGLCWTPQWHPEEDVAAGDSGADFEHASDAMVYAGVGRKTS